MAFVGYLREVVRTYGIRITVVPSRWGNVVDHTLVLMFATARHAAALVRLVVR